MAIELKRDTEHEGYSKLPRQGMWSWHCGDIVYRCQCMNAPLLNAHTIERDGAVQPSVVCTIGGCSFHEFVKLEGWTEADHAEKKRRQYAPSEQSQRTEAQ
jgi:hypothetical protein